MKSNNRLTFEETIRLGDWVRENKEELSGKPFDTIQAKADEIVGKSVNRSRLRSLLKSRGVQFVLAARGLSKIWRSGLDKVYSDIEELRKDFKEIQEYVVKLRSEVSQFTKNLQEIDARLKSTQNGLRGGLGR